MTRSSADSRRSPITRLANSRMASTMVEEYDEK